MVSNNNQINCRHQHDYWEEECSQCDGLKKCRITPSKQMQFFLPIIPPTVTHQEKQVRVVKMKPVFYEPAELKAARAKLMANLSQYTPVQPFTEAVQLVTKWCFPIADKHSDGEYKTTKPDTDNMIKLLKDCMTACGYWKDDSIVASEVTEKFWAQIPGIYISIKYL